LEHYFLVFLQWAGKIIGGRVAGTILNSAWKRISPSLERRDTTLRLWRRKNAETTEIAKEVKKLNGEAFALIEEAFAKIAALKAENAELRRRLAKYEPPDPE
jgi:hypothetical protein